MAPCRQHILTINMHRFAQNWVLEISVVKLNIMIFIVFLRIMCRPGGVPTCILNEILRKKSFKPNKFIWYIGGALYNLEKEFKTIQCATNVPNEFVRFEGFFSLFYVT